MGLVRVEIIMNEVKMDRLIEAIKKFRITGMTVYKAMGCGVQYGTPEYQEEDTNEINLLKKTVITLIMAEDKLDKFIDYLKKHLYTGHIGDGKIFVSEVTNAFRIRTGEEGMDAVTAPKY